VIAICDIIKVSIRCSSEECEELREQGLFFLAIADALFLDRDDIEEIVDETGQEKNQQLKREQR
jgi:hypothetical protein